MRQSAPENQGTNHTTTNDILYTKIYGKGFRYNVFVKMYTIFSAHNFSLYSFFLQKFALIACGETHTAYKRRGGSSQKPVVSNRSVLQNLGDEVEERRKALHFAIGVIGLSVLLLLIVWY